jgi:hypothetical protein
MYVPTGNHCSMEPLRKWFAQGTESYTLIRMHSCPEAEAGDRGDTPGRSLLLPGPCLLGVEES